MKLAMVDYDANCLCSNLNDCWSVSELRREDKSRPSREAHSERLMVDKVMMMGNDTDKQLDRSKDEMIEAQDLKQL